MSKMNRVLPRGKSKGLILAKIMEKQGCTNEFKDWTNDEILLLFYSKSGDGL